MPNGASSDAAAQTARRDRLRSGRFGRPPFASLAKKAQNEEPAEGAPKTGMIN